MKRKSKGKSIPKQLTGRFKQVDTLSEKKTMGNPGGKSGKRMAKAREKRLERASV